jgi:hypothetical protein
MSIHARAINFNSAPDAVVAWRARRLSEAGLPSELAQRVAADCVYDLHALLELIDRGCPPGLAVRILAPLEEGVTR